jgi:hypothetical protein
MELEKIIHKYIKEIGGKIEEKQENPNAEFIFRFKYPNPKIGRNFFIVKPIGKNYIEIFSRTLLSPEHKKKFENLSEKQKLRLSENIHQITLRNILTINIQFKENQIFNIIEKIYLSNNEEIDINLFYRTIRRIFSCVMECVLMIQDFFSSTYESDYLRLI